MPKIQLKPTLHIIDEQDEDFEDKVIEKLLPLLLGGGMTFHEACKKIVYQIKEESDPSPNNSLSSREDLIKESLELVRKYKS